MPGSFTMCCLRACRAELLDILAEIDTLTPKSLWLNNNILGSMQDCKKSLSAPFTTLKCTILDADQLSCFGAKIFVKFMAVAVRFFAGSPFHTDAFHWNFLFLMRHSDSKHSNSALTQCFQCICSEVQASATLAVSRESPICFVALPHCMMFSS